MSCRGGAAASPGPSCLRTSNHSDPPFPPAPAPQIPQSPHPTRQGSAASTGHFRQKKSHLVRAVWWAGRATGGKSSGKCATPQARSAAGAFLPGEGASSLAALARVPQQNTADISPSHRPVEGEGAPPSCGRGTENTTLPPWQGRGNPTDYHSLATVPVGPRFTPEQSSKRGYCEPHFRRGNGVMCLVQGHNDTGGLQKAAGAVCPGTLDMAPCLSKPMFLLLF